MNVLVTGGSGFVGRHVVRELVARGYGVVATHCDPPGTRRPRCAGLSWVKWDGTRDALPRVTWKRLDAVIHLAVPGGLFVFPDNARALFELEVAGTFRLLEAVRQHGLRRILLASTGYALGTRTELHREKDLYGVPATFYGTSKACAELLTQAYGDTISAAVVRLYWPYGPGGERYVIHRLLQAVASEQEVFVEGRNGMVMNPVWVQDAARGIALALESDAGGVFHIGGSEVVTMRELIVRMGVLLGTKPTVRVRPRGINICQAGRCDRSRRILGYRPKVGLDAGLKMLLENKSS